MYTRGNGLIGPKGSVNNKINKLLSIIVIVVISSINSSTLLFGNSPCLYLDCTLFCCYDWNDDPEQNPLPFADGRRRDNRKKTYIDNTCWWGLPNLCIYSLNNSHLSNSATTQQFKLFPSSLYLWSIVISGGNSRCGVQWGGANRLGMAPLSPVSLSVVILRLCPYCGTGKACSLAISSGFRNRSSKSNKSSGFSQL